MGFTLVEMLVVLVILAMTTGLLASALPIVWQSFAKLEQKQLNQSVNLAAKWFRQSIQGALLYHPDNVVFTGTATKLSMITNAPLDDPNNMPSQIIWEIKQYSVAQFGSQQAKVAYDLWYNNQRTQTIIKVHTFNSPAYFNYIVDNKWQLMFTPNKAMLPDAVSIMVDQSNSIESGASLWLLAAPINPVNVEIPPEMIVFGQYEF
jgi:general secretion pathway protein J